MLRNPTNPLLVVESLYHYPNTLISSKGTCKVLDTHTNLEWLLGHFNVEIRHNLMSRRREIDFPGRKLFADDVENDVLGWVHHLSILNGMPISRLDEHLDLIANSHAYHPIVDCIKAKAWDGVPRLDQFIATIKTENMSLAYKIIKTWMMAAVSAAYSVEGFVNQGVLVLQGKQNLGKTRWVKSLEPVACGAIKEGAMLDPSNKDSVLLLASHWIVELGELDATFRKADIARLKSFITMQADDVRSPYARRSTRLPRRTAYVATVNEENFLGDETGNRRWWVIPVDEIDIDHKLDMQQVWAEARIQSALGSLSYFAKEVQDEVNESNKDHEKIDPLREKLLDWYDWKNPNRKWMTASAVLEEIGYKMPDRVSTTRMGALLREINGKKGRKSNGLLVHEVPVNVVFRNS